MLICHCSAAGADLDLAAHAKAELAELAGALLASLADLARPGQAKTLIQTLEGVKSAEAGAAPEGAQACLDEAEFQALEGEGIAKDVATLEDAQAQAAALWRQVVGATGLLVAWAPAENLPGFLHLVLDRAAGTGDPGLDPTPHARREADSAPVSSHGADGGEVAALCRALLGSGDLWELPALLPAWPQAVAGMLAERLGLEAGSGPLEPDCLAGLEAGANHLAGTASAKTRKKSKRKQRGCSASVRAETLAGCPGSLTSSAPPSGQLGDGFGASSQPTFSFLWDASRPPFCEPAAPAGLANELTQTLNLALRYVPAAAPSSIGALGEPPGLAIPYQDAGQGLRRLLPALRMLAAAPPAGYFCGGPAADLARLALRVECALLRLVACPSASDPINSPVSEDALVCLAAARAWLASLLMCERCADQRGCNGYEAGDLSPSPNPSAAGALAELGTASASWLLGACDAATCALARAPPAVPGLGQGPELAASASHAWAALEQLFEATGGALRALTVHALRPQPAASFRGAGAGSGKGLNSGVGYATGGLLEELLAQAERRARVLLPEAGSQSRHTGPRAAGVPARALGRWLLGLLVGAVAGPLADAAANAQDDGGNREDGQGRVEVQLVAGARPFLGKT